MMQKRRICLALLMIALAATPAWSVTDEEAIRAVMNAQVRAWNAGDIEAFVEGYKKSPDLLFASRGTFSRGWEPLLKRYKEHYPEGNMGTLQFDGIEIKMLGSDTAWVVGFWRLEMKDGSPHGAFTLIFERTKEGWRIIHDHTSSAKED
jgi:beta-aspartyl-peptidase (threonine type)